MQTAHFALLAFGRVHFNVDLGKAHFDRFRQELAGRGYTFSGPEEPLTDPDAARAAVARLAEEPVDGLLIFFTTFADTRFLTEAVEPLDVPVFLWAVPDVRTGERLQTATFPGINLAAHALTRQRRGFAYAYASLEDEQGWQRLGQFAAASQVYCGLRRLRLGVLGERPEGMDTCDLDEDMLLHRLGVAVKHVELQQVFNRMLAAGTQATSELRSQLDERLDNLETLDPRGLALTLNAFQVMKEISQADNLGCLAVRCWPEFFVDLGCAACGAISMLSDACIPATCEADANGAVSHWILQTLAGGPAFTTDIVEVDTHQDEIVLWHCGQAPLSLADPEVRPHGVLHSNRKVPMMMDFPLKPGPVTLLRLSQAGGTLQFFVGKGEMLKAPKAYTGTSGVFRFERPAQEFLDRILTLGLEHHISLAYGDFVNTLKLLADLLQIPCAQL